MKRFIKEAVVTFLLLLSMPGIAAVPMLLNYQGNVVDGGGIPVEGTGYFKFAIVNQAGDTAYWVSNGATLDGSAPPNAVAIPVHNGVFSVKLGDTNLTNMSALTQPVFDNPAIYLRVWFSIDNINFEKFTGDIQILSGGFAFKAAVADTVQDSAVTTQTIQDNTITNADISGTAAIDASKINSLGLDADTLDGLNSTDFAKTTDLTWFNLSSIPAGFADGVDNVGITGVTAGTGLTGGGTSGNVTLSADTTVLQARVGSSCPTGQSIRVINSNGTVTCETDDNTTYTAGQGINITGTTINTTSGIKFVNNVSNQNINGTNAVYQTLNITAPSSGYIIVHAHGNRYCTTNTTSFSTWLTNTTTAEGSQTRSMAPNADIWTAYSTSFVFTVDAGANTITLTARCAGATTNGTFFITTMYGMFIANVLP